MIHAWRELRRSGAVLGIAGLWVALSLGAADARAQGKTTVPDHIPPTNGSGVGLNLFQPAMDSRGFFSVNGADALGGGDISFGLVLDYGHDLIPVNPGHGSDWVVSHAFKGVFHFDYGIANVLVVGLSAPVVVNGGGSLTDVGPGGKKDYDSDPLNAQGLGDLALHLKVPILRPDGAIGIALVASAGVGVGGTRNFLSEPGFFYWPELVLEERVGHVLRVALNAGYRGHTGDNPVFGIARDGKPQLKSGVFENSNLLTSSFALSVRPTDVLDLVAETYTTYQVGGTSDRSQRLSAEALGGIKLFMEKSSFFSMGAGPGYTPGFQTAQVRATIGFVYEPSLGERAKPEPDRDHDGVPDKYDRCPDVPGDRTGREDDDGCPFVQKDPPDADRDGDGILDKNDKCPDEPEDRDGFQDEDGCPELDNDGDGIPDARDKCPNQPEDRDGFQDEDGCPDPDNDGDGIPDARDKCPNDAETFNGFEDADGCPDQGRVVIQDNTITTLDKILFKTGSAEILPESLALVEAVATTITHHPEFTLLEVQGHADERGAPRTNLRLTQERSVAVVEALVKIGIDRGRLRAMGYGSYCPIDPGHGAAAWDRNRRVELKVVTENGALTSVVLGCEKARARGVAPPPPPVKAAPPALKAE